MPRATAPKLRSTLILGLIVVAVAAPTVQARIAVDPPGAPAGEIATPPVRPDDRADRPSVVPTSDATASVTRPDEGTLRNPAAAPGEVAANDTVATDGFNWTDALIGAGIGIAAALLAFCAFLLSRRRGKTARALLAREGEVH